ncbi:hypothetical protein [Nocardioides sp. CER19]|uniref:hypothetical protein n=1 Tax=Nocardioides sp. CER19 TaxID=3038538 RepID=UPI00244ABC4B|nr:hypothetical protein [Nocardioides sp. CER19]MDH2412649.1 hypothetical protein [Nocardioides sp. CER19]
MSRPDDAGPQRHASIVRVTGGDHLRVPYQDVSTMADAFDHTGDRALACAGRVGAVAVSPDLLASAAFSPGTALVAEAATGALAAALTAWAAAITAHAATVRHVVAELERADALVHDRILVEERLVASLYGREWVPPDVRPTELQVPMSSAAPTGLDSLVDHAGQMSELSGPGSPDNKGTVEVQTLTGTDGRRRHVVYLPGMDDLTPFSVDSDVRDVGAAVSLEAGVPTAYGAGALEAMHQAGIRSGEPVLLVGHSQGGMQALQLASAGSPYDVTQVVTLGSPAVPGTLPPGLGVLSLEHQGDPVPLVDAGAEAGSMVSPHHVTVTFDSGTSPSVADNHGFPHYSAGAVAAEQSTDPVVQEALIGLDPFLGQPGDEVRSTVFQITRG